MSSYIESLHDMRKTLTLASDSTWVKGALIFVEQTKLIECVWHNSSVESLIVSEIGRVKSRDANARPLLKEPGHYDECTRRVYHGHRDAPAKTCTHP